MKEIILNKKAKFYKNHLKFTAFIDDEDFDKVNQYNWHYWSDGKRIEYARGTVNGKEIYMHNFILGIKGVDHINHNGLDNQKHNLRITNHHQNMMNQRPPNGKTSPYKGVSWNKERKKWEGKIMFNKKNTFIGYFSDEKTAAIAYNAKAQELFGEYAYLNVIT